VLATAEIFEFEEFRLDRHGEGLCRRNEDGVLVPLPVGARALDVLSVLVERAGELVTKEQIMAAVWRRSVVENANLTVQMAALRRVLDQGRADGSCIQTVAVRGYRFLPAVTRVEPAAIPQGIAPRLSIVVLPFADLSEGGGQQYFTDGITDDLTTDLSRLRNVLVISRNTAFAYKDQRVDAKQIGRELGVRYLLEGSVRRSGNQVRVNAQLIDAATNTHLWAERFDHDIGDLFALQNEITGRIANTLGWQLIGAETARPPDRPDALDYLLRGRAVQGTGNVRENVEKAVGLFERALALDPSSVEAQSRLANALINRSALKDPAAAAVDLKHAEQLLAEALAASPGDPYAHHTTGKLLRLTRRCEEAIPEFEISLAANRNDPNTLVQLSVCKYLTGGSDREAIALVEQAIRLSPRDPGMGWWHTWIGFVHLLQSRIDEAIASLEKARSLDPRAWNTHQFLAAAYGFKGERERARAELAEAKRLVGSDRYSSVAHSRANGDLYTPALRDRWETVYFPGIRAAGQPEE
jgi:TolB-like protein/tetratricopeptide (TPR) repeat protein